ICSLLACADCAQQAIPCWARRGTITALCQDGEDGFTMRPAFFTGLTRMVSLLGVFLSTMTRHGYPHGYQSCPDYPDDGKRTTEQKWVYSERSSRKAETDVEGDAC